MARMVGTNEIVRAKKSWTPKELTVATTAFGSKRKGTSAILPKPKMGKKGDDKV